MDLGNLEFTKDIDLKMKNVSFDKKSCFNNLEVDFSFFLL